MNLNDDDFTLLGVPKTFAQNSNVLRRAYLTLQEASHPDRFPLGTPEEKRLALAWSSRINEAYTRLSNPITRAQAWCALWSDEPSATTDSPEHRTTLDSAKPKAISSQLMQQHMEWRESAEDFFNQNNQAALSDLLANIEAHEHEMLNALEHSIDVLQDRTKAQENIAALQFLTQLKGQLKQMLFALENP